jgi:hypothetical protein
MSKLNHPEIRKAWEAFLKEAQAHYPGELDPSDADAIGPLARLIDPPAQYDEEGVVVVSD